MPKLHRESLAVACLLLFASPLFAQPPAPEAARPTPVTELRVSRATSPIVVDGRLDDAGWETATRIPLSYEWFPGDNIAPPVETMVLVTFDSEHLYVAFDARDPDPGAIRAHLMDRDSIDTFVQDDHVLLMVDPFNDERRGFQLRVNPLGVQADAVFSQVEGIEDFSWDIIWSSAGNITAEGYVVEIGVPLAQLRFPRGADEQTWGFDLGRSYPRNVRHRITAQPRDRNNNCVLCQVVKLTGFSGLEPGRNLEVTPTLTAGRTDTRASFPSGDFEDGDEDFEPGISARWGLTPNLTLNATVNPDFSQVEADTAQLAVNQRFALFFPEKRPFFLEGIDFFATPLDVVFTRTVVDPDWGLKLTGKQGRHAGGVFATRDDVTALLIPSNQGSASALLDQEVTAGVLRYRHDVGSNSTVGVLFAGREGDGYHNRVGGFDGFFRLGDSDEIRFQGLRSETLYPGALAAQFGQSPDSFSGEAFRVTYNHLGRQWLWFARYDDLDPDFRADSGFVPRVDVRTATGGLTRRFWGNPQTWYSQVNLNLTALRTEDHSGRLTDERLDFTVDFSGPRQSFAFLSLESNAELVDTTLYEDLHRVELYGEAQPTGKAKGTLYAQHGDGVDYANNRPADVSLLQPGLELKLGRHVNARLNHTWQVIDVEGGELTEANLSQLRLVYNFNVRSFVRTILQYTDISRDPTLYTFPVSAEDELLFTQLLFSYKLNPQTVLFLGYSDTHLGNAGIDLTQASRTFFFKVGYAWLI